MPTTSNFGWTTPADTDLVKDGAAAIRTLGNGIDSSLVDLKGGTTGQILSKASNTDLDYTWIANDQGDITEVQAGTGISVASGTGPIPVVTNTVATTFDAKGDLVAGTGADTFAKLTVGANNTVLTADSTTATGLKWAAPSGASFSGWLAYVNPSTTAITTATATYLTFDGEDIDTDAYHSLVTNPSRFTIPSGKAGKYLISICVQWQGPASSTSRETGIRKNGSSFVMAPYVSGTNTDLISFSYILDLAVSDYIEVYVYQASGSNCNVVGNNAGNGRVTFCAGTFLGA